MKPSYSTLTSNFTDRAPACSSAMPSARVGLVFVNANGFLTATAEGVPLASATISKGAALRVLPWETIFSGNPSSLKK